MDYLKLKKYFGSQNILNVFVKRVVIIFVCVIAALRISIYYHYLLGREYYFHSDDAIYAALARRFLSGDFWHAFHPYWSPGFPLVTVPFYLITNSWENAQFLVSVTAVILLIFVLFWFFRRFSLFLSFTIAFITAFSISLQKLVVSGGMTEPLYILLLWIGIAFSWLALKIPQKRYYIYAGIFFGLAYLTRTEATIFFASFLFISALQVFVQKISFKEKLINWITRIGLALCFFVLINSPYIVFQSLQLGRFTISGKYAFYGTGPYFALEKDRPSTLAQDIWSIDYIDYSSPYFNPDRAKKFMVKYFLNGSIPQQAKKTFIESLTLYKSENTNNFFVGFGLYLTLIGFFLGVIDSKFRTLTLYLTFLWFIGLIWVCVFMVTSYRYIVYAFPFFFYLQALAVYSSNRLFISLAKLFNKKVFHLVFVIISIILPGLLLADFFMKNVSLSSITTIQSIGGNKDHKLLGEWVRGNKIDVLGGRLEGLAFYANAKLVYMPSSSPEDIVKYMKQWGVEYLLVRPQEVGYAHVAPIASPKYQNSDLTLIKQFDNGSLVWRIRLSTAEKAYNERIRRQQKFNL